MTAEEVKTDKFTLYGDAYQLVKVTSTATNASQAVSFDTGGYEDVEIFVARDGITTELERQYSSRSILDKARIDYINTKQGQNYVLVVSYSNDANVKANGHEVVVSYGAVVEPIKKVAVGLTSGLLVALILIV